MKLDEDMKDTSKALIDEENILEKFDCKNVLVDSECQKSDKSQIYFSKEHIVQFGIVLTVSLTTFASGMQYGWVGPTLRQLMFNETDIIMDDKQGIYWIVSSLKIGSIIGPFLGLFLADCYGRKMILLLSAIPFLIGWFIRIIGNKVYELCLAELISGIAIAMVYSVLPIYIGEIASPKIRGTLTIIIPIQFSIGFLIENIIVPFISVSSNAAIAIVVILIFLFTFCWMPESPYYYVMKNCPQKAANSLCTLTQSNFVDDKLESIKNSIQIQRAENVGIYQIFTDPINRKAFWIVLGLSNVHQFSGFIVVLLYAQVIFEKGDTPINADLGGIIMCSAGLIILFFSFHTVDKLGRRPLLLFSSIASSVPMLINGLYFHLKAFKYENIDSYSIVPILALIVFKITFGIGIGPVFFVSTSEMFNTSFKTYATCIIYSYIAITNVIIVSIFHVIADIYGEHYPFYFFAICCICGTVFIYYFIPETKGKTLEEIQLYLKNN